MEGEFPRAARSATSSLVGCRARLLLTGCDTYFFTGVRASGKDAPSGAELAARIGNLGFVAIALWQVRERACGSSDDNLT